MRAVLLATGHNAEMDALLHFRPTPMLNVADKPIIFHIIEFLARHHINQFDLILSHLPETIEAHVEDGLRWGVHVRYHLAKDPSYPFKTLSTIAKGWDYETVLLGMGDCLPKLSNRFFSRKTPVMLSFPNHHWSGWGIIPTAILKDIDPTSTVESFQHHLHEKIPNELIEPFLSTQSFEALKEGNQTFITLEKDNYLFPSTAKQVEPGVWISRAVKLKPSVEILPPVFIGEYCQIEDGVTIGPNAIIENHCIIDQKSVIEDSLVFQNSYVGENLEIKGSIIDRNLLINMDIGVNTTIVDDFILSELGPPSFFCSLIRWFERFIGSIFVLLTSPLFWYMQRNHIVKTKKVIFLPSPQDPVYWKEFSWHEFRPKKGHYPTGFERYIRRLPLLLNVMRGEIHFVGLDPRTVEELKQMPSDWVKIYLRAKVGFITLATLDHGEHPTHDEKYASEVYYSSRMNWKQDTHLFIRWFIRKWKIGFKGLISKVKRGISINRQHN